MGPTVRAFAAETALADRDASIVALRGGLTQEAAYVENITAGDKTKIESAGMAVRSDAAPIGPPTQVLNLVVTAGDIEGTLDAAWDQSGAVRFVLGLPRRVEAMPRAFALAASRRGE